MKKVVHLLFVLFFGIFSCQKKSDVIYELDYGNNSIIYVSENSGIIINESTIERSSPNIVVLQSERFNFYQGSVKDKFTIIPVNYDQFNLEIKDVSNDYEIFYNEKKGIFKLNEFLCKEYVVLKNGKLSFRIFIDTQSKLNNVDLYNYFFKIPFSKVKFPRGLVVGISSENNKDIEFSLKSIRKSNLLLQLDVQKDIKKFRDAGDIKLNIDEDHFIIESPSFDRKIP